MKNNFISNVFGWMFIGLLITFGSGILVMNSMNLMYFLFSGSMYIFLLIAQVVIALVMGVRIHKMNPLTAKLLYVGYCILTGISFASLFLIFELTSIIMIFLATAIIFGIFALIGKTTKIDLSRMSVFLFMGLLAIIILEIINIFILNNTLNMITCIISIIIFMGYIAYDMQKIIAINNNGYGTDNLAIYGAFQLYLDFINIFIKLLSLFGKRRD